MSEAIAGTLPARPNLNTRPHAAGPVIFLALLAVGIGYTLYGLLGDIEAAHTPPVAIGAFVLLGIALLIALGFEFVNGFHDTANAVATVIYTHSLPPHVAVVWSGVFNFLGVMVSSGAVAFSVLSLVAGGVDPAGRRQRRFRDDLRAADRGDHLEPGHLVARAAREFVAHADRLDHRRGPGQPVHGAGGVGTSGVDWAQAMGVFSALLFSPVVGFVFAALLLLVMKLLVRNQTLYTAPTADRPPPAWIRGLLILTCTGVSFAHGSNDGQKGMGLIMLILIGAVPTAYALNHAMPSSTTPAFFQATEDAQAVFEAHAAGTTLPSVAAARTAVTEAVKQRRTRPGDLGRTRHADRRYRAR